MNKIVAVSQALTSLFGGAPISQCARYVRCFLGFTCLLVTSDATLAQDSKPPSIKVGESDVTPTLRIDYVTVDNTFRTPSDPIETNGLIVSPGVTWEADRRLLKLSAGYSGRYGSYDESTLDFNDHLLRFRLEAQPGTRHRVSSELSLNLDHEDLGTGQTRFSTNLNDQIETTRLTFRSQYTFGAANAQGNLSAGLIVSSESFDNLPELTEGDDNTAIRPYAQFSYRLSPDTRLIAETRFGTIDFDDDNRDRDEVSFLTGVDLRASARTSGRVRVGVTEASFDDANRSDTSLFVADVDLTYRPRSFSSFNLSFNRDLNNVDNDDDGSQETIVDEFALSWSHRWNSRIASRAIFEKELFGRDCPRNSTETDTISLEIGVNIRRWISVGVTGRNAQRSVSDCSGIREEGAAGYEVNRVGLFLRATL